MARNVPSSLLQAVGSSTQQPAFQITIQDLQTRYAVVAATQAPGRSAVLVTASGALLRAVLSQRADPNSVSVQRIGDPTQPSQWTAPGAAAALDVTASAGVALVQTGATIRCFYQRAADKLICYRDSIDDGLTWGAEQAIPGIPLSTAPLCCGLAARSITDVLQVCSVYAVPGTAGLFARSRLTTSWSSWSNEGPPSPTFYQLRGLQLDTLNGTDRLAFGAQGPNLYNGLSAALCLYTPSTYQPWSIVQPLDNPDLGLVTAWPTIHRDTANNRDLYVAQLTDDGSRSTTPLSRTRVYASTDGTHWTPIAEFAGLFAYETHAMMLGTTLYVFDAATTVSLANALPSADVSDDVLAVSLSSALNQEGRLEVTLSNERGQYNAHPGVRTDAHVTLSIGYGTTTVTTGIFLVDAYTYGTSDVRRTLVLQCRDCLKLLDYPSPRMLSYTGQTVGQLIAQVGAWAGLAIAPLPATPQFSQAVPCFSVSQGETWLRALSRLAGIYGFRFWCDETPRLRVVEPQPADPAAWSFGTEAPAMSQTWAADQANVVRVVGADASGNAVFAQAVDSAAALTVGRERYKHVLDRQLDTAARCAIRAAIEIRDEQMAAYDAQIVAAPNPVIELGDVVTLNDPATGSANQPARIVHMALAIDPEHGLYDQTLQCSGV